MSRMDDGADQVDHGEASLGEAQSDNPPVDPEYIAGDGPPAGADVAEGHGARTPRERGDEGPAVNAP